MAEYRIAARLDAETSAGSAKVKQDLKGIQTEAKATQTALNRSFDQQAFEKTIGGLLTRVKALEGGLKKASDSSNTLRQSNETLGQSLDRLAASMDRSAQKTTQQGKATDDSAKKQANLEAALRRVLQATDAQAAEQQRLNALVADAKRLLDAGAISQERYAQVQKMAADAGKAQNTQTGNQRIGLQQLGYQLGDVATMWSLGAKPAQIFASQIGQVAQAITLMSDGSSKFAKFIGGPWGIALTVATIILAPFVAKLFEGNNALDDAIDKLRKDAKETETNRLAKERFKYTQEGVTAALRDAEDARRKEIELQRTSAERANIEAQNNLRVALTVREKIAAQLEYNKAMLDAQVQRATRGGPQGEAAALSLGRYQQQLADTEKALSNQQALIGRQQLELDRTRADIAAEAAKRSADPVEMLNRKYDQLIQKAKDAADVQIKGANGNRAALDRVNRTLYGQVAAYEEQRKAAIKSAQDAARASNAGTGVATFKSRAQAVGIAGRELQSAGYRVSENAQFGGVTPGAHRSGHQNAIDVNSGSGVIESNVPDLKSKFDALAKRYQARGYRVLWNGQVYEAGGNGPTRRIPAGQDQHRDHMHVEAPATIVGKATGASTEAQARREEAAAARVAESASDFVQGIVNGANARGTGNRTDALNAEIDKTLAEFERRFNRPASGEERGAITKALTDADAKEIARHFDDAYVAPLKRLQALQGTAGVDREVLNKKLEETERLGRALTPVEEKLIENSVRQGDALTRQAQILEQARGPLAEYAAQIKALKELLDSGAISQTTFNARVSELGRGAVSLLQGSQGVDPATGRSYQDLGAIGAENDRYAQEQEAMRNNRQILLDMGVDFDAMEEAQRQQHIENLAKIDQARQDVMLKSAQSVGDSLLSILENTAGRQSAVYKGMFAVTKAFAIAESIINIQRALASATASLPFPANLPVIATVAAEGASIISSIMAVAQNFANGGLIRGPGGPRSDSIPINASNGEFMVNAKATAANLPLLEAINSGRTYRGAAPAGAAGSPALGQQRSRVSVQQYPGVDVEVSENLTTGDVEIIARRIVDRHAGDAASRDLARPNSNLAKGINTRTTARMRKS